MKLTPIYRTQPSRRRLACQGHITEETRGPEIRKLTSIFWGKTVYIFQRENLQGPVRWDPIGKHQKGFPPVFRGTLGPVAPHQKRKCVALAALPFCLLHCTNLQVTCQVARASPCFPRNPNLFGLRGWLARALHPSSFVPSGFVSRATPPCGKRNLNRNTACTQQEPCHGN